MHYCNYLVICYALSAFVLVGETGFQPRLGTRAGQEAVQCHRSRNKTEAT